MTVKVCLLCCHYFLSGMVRCQNIVLLQGNLNNFRLYFTYFSNNSDLVVKGIDTASISPNYSSKFCSSGQVGLSRDCYEQSGHTEIPSPPDAEQAGERNATRLDIMLIQEREL